MKKLLGWLLIILLSLFPVLIWIAMHPVSERFANASSSFTSIGQLSALIGAVLLGITFLFNTRLKFLENIFGGLDKVYIAHHILGTVSFLFLLFHPIFLALKFATFSASSALSFLLPGQNLAINFGIFALTSMILLLFLTFFINMKYNIWKLTHQFLGLSLLLAAIHIILIPSDISRNVFLKTYILFFITLGILSFLYKTLLHNIFIKKYNYKVKEVSIFGNITEIKLESDNIFNYTPGQFIFINFPSISKEYHPFSITSSLKDFHISISVKSLGDYTKDIKNIKSGEPALIEGPYGRFKSNAKDQIWVAGGIGITPFLSMAKNLKEKKADLYYCVNKKEEAVFLPELKAIAEKNKNFNLIPHYSNEKGHITANYINNTSKNIKEKDILLCGPVSMMTSLKKSFKSLGINTNKIRSEEFKLL